MLDSFSQVSKLSLFDFSTGIAFNLYINMKLWRELTDL